MKKINVEFSLMDYNVEATGKVDSRENYIHDLVLHVFSNKLDRVIATHTLDANTFDCIEDMASDLIMEEACSNTLNFED